MSVPEVAAWLARMSHVRNLDVLDPAEDKYFGLLGPALAQVDTMRDFAAFHRYAGWPSIACRRSVILQDLWSPRVLPSGPGETMCRWMIPDFQYQAEELAVVLRYDQYCDALVGAEAMFPNGPPRNARLTVILLPYSAPSVAVQSDPEDGAGPWGMLYTLLVYLATKIDSFERVTLVGLHQAPPPLLSIPKEPDGTYDVPDRPDLEQSLLQGVMKVRERINREQGLGLDPRPSCRHVSIGGIAVYADVLGDDDWELLTDGYDTTSAWDPRVDGPWGFEGLTLAHVIGPPSLAAGDTMKVRLILEPMYSTADQLADGELCEQPSRQ